MKISITNISKHYNRQRILDNVSFEAQSGDMIGILGKNGCGKTTLLSIIAGTEKADSGRIVFSEKGGRSLIGYLPQINPLMDEVSIYDNLSLWIDDISRIDEVLEMYDFADIRKKKVGKLSGGMKRRVAIMCALSNSPRLLIMDEPTASLDIEYKKDIHDLMTSFVSSGGTIILVTHEKEEMDMCTRCYYLENGMLSNSKS